MKSKRTVNNYFRNRGKSITDPSFSSHKKDLKGRDPSPFAAKNDLKEAKVISCDDISTISIECENQYKIPDEDQETNSSKEFQRTDTKFKFKRASKPSKNPNSKVRESIPTRYEKNLKRRKTDSGVDESGDHEVVIPSTSLLEGSKHNKNAAIFGTQKEADNTVPQNAGKQVTFSDDVGIISSKREQKRNSKVGTAQVLDLLSYTTLGIIKETLDERQGGSNDTTSLEKNAEISSESNQNREKGSKRFDPVDSNNGNQLPRKSQEGNSKSSVLGKLSNKTLEILRKVQKEKKREDKDQWICERTKTSGEVQADKILKGFSISEKYDDLLSEAPQIVMPVHYKLLIKFFAALDDAVFFLKKRGKVCAFEEIAVSVESSTKRSFNMANFCQILTVSPDSFIYEWKDLKGYRGYSLILDVPGRNHEVQSVSQKRKDDFRNKLLEKALECHQKFLNQIMIKRPALKEILEDFDPIKMRGWYHEFDPHTRVPPIEPKQIASKPKSTKRGESVSEFMKRNRSIQKKFSLSHLSGSRESSVEAKEEVFPNTLSSGKKKFELSLESKSSTKITTIKGIPMDLFSRIQLKEKASQDEIQEKNNEYKLDKPKIERESLMRLIESLKSIYSVRNLNTLALKKVLSVLADTTRGKFESTVTINQKLQDLCMASPDWLKIVSTPRGEFIKMKLNYPKKNVKVDIERYIKQKYSGQE
ncbi:unnamed protein product [Moneuplotes crassus]|uniref:CDT1 Geminin-binding domain-containing protein n=2 Tax=Euplotes crassus TaxID=5936 RepID=A0AAD1Y979_EUPCR|nr:unnamed protein product [Moneuplotes crassus]